MITITINRRSLEEKKAYADGFKAAYMTLEGYVHGGGEI